MEITVHLLVLVIIGIVCLIIGLFIGLNNTRVFKKELKNLKKHLHTQMEINALGTETQKKEIEKLKKRIENLQSTLTTLNAKTSTEEKRMLLLYDRAIHLMYEKAPGFATSWEMILKEAQAELDNADDGTIKFTKKIIRPSLFKKAKSFIENLDNSE